jgi:hypothetical protein
MSTTRTRTAESRRRDRRGRGPPDGGVQASVERRCAGLNGAQTPADDDAVENFHGVRRTDCALEREEVGRRRRMAAAVELSADLTQLTVRVRRAVHVLDEDELTGEQQDGHKHRIALAATFRSSSSSHYGRNATPRVT